MNRAVLIAVLLAGALSGCASNVQMSLPTVPEPLVRKIPVNIGLRMPENFHRYVHEEDVLGRDEWSIDLGDANASLFTQLFAHMFRSVRIISADEDPRVMGLDALVEPSIDKFEFSTPAQSNTESFAVWIRYRLKVYDRDGKLVSNWPLSAYGKSSSDGVKDTRALQRAAVLAMRDAAALMVMKFDKITRISELAEEPEYPIAPALGREETEDEET